MGVAKHFLQMWPAPQTPLDLPHQAFNPSSADLDPGHAHQCGPQSRLSSFHVSRSLDGRQHQIVFFWLFFCLLWSSNQRARSAVNEKINSVTVPCLFILPKS